MRIRSLAVIGLFLGFSTIGYAAPGALDLAFGIGGVVESGLSEWHDEALGVAVQADGKVLVTGYAVGVQGTNFDVTVARYEPDGTLDQSFGASGIAQYNHAGFRDYGNAIALQPDGKILVAGFASTGTWEWDKQALVLRYSPDGTLDPEFGTGGAVLYDGSPYEDEAHGLMVQPDGKIVVVGGSSYGAGGRAFLLRYHPNGTPDLDFGVSGAATFDLSPSYHDAGYAVALQGDGLILIAGESPYFNSSRAFVLRCNQDGTRDTTFGSQGVAYHQEGTRNSARSMAVQPDGRIVLAGTTWDTLDDATDRILVVRFRSDGTLDESFGNLGAATYGGTGEGPEEGHAVALQTGGKIVVAGSSSTGTSRDLVVLRYTAAGALDPTFGGGGVVTYRSPRALQQCANGVAVFANGDLLVAGSLKDALNFLDDALLLKLVGHSAGIGASAGFADLGSIAVSLSSDPEAFTISNTGDSDLTIQSVQLVGADAGEFRVEEDLCSAQVLPASTGCIVRILFSPTSVGSKSAILRVTSSVPEPAVVEIALAASGIQAPAPPAEPGTAGGETSSPSGGAGGGGGGCFVTLLDLGTTGPAGLLLPLASLLGAFAFARRRKVSR